MPRQRLALGTAGEINTVRRQGYWRARAWFRDYDGRRRQLEATGHTEGIARTRLREKLSRRQRAVEGIGITGATTVSQLAHAWLEEIRRSKRTPQTVDHYAGTLSRHGLPAIGELRLDEVRVSILDRLIKATADTAPAQGYLLRVVLRQMFALAVRHDALESNLAAATATVERAKKTPVSLHAEDIAKLRSAVRLWRTAEGTVLGPRPNGVLPVAVDVMLGTGVRIAEALALRWCDVDIDHPTTPTVTVAGTMVYLKGEGTLRQSKPKTASGHRELHLPPFAALALRQLHSADVDPLAPVFATRSGTYTSPANFRRSLRSALLEAGLEANRWHPHQLRVTVATTLARGEVGGIENAAAVLGHSGTEVTRAHYVERLRRAPDVNTALQALVEATESGAAA